MSQLILPNKAAPINIEFNVAVLPSGEMAIQATWSGGMIQLPPVAAEIIDGIGNHLSSAAKQVIEKRAILNGQLLSVNGSRPEAL